MLGDDFVWNCFFSKVPESLHVVSNVKHGPVFFLLVFTLCLRYNVCKKPDFSWVSLGVYLLKVNVWPERFFSHLNVDFTSTGDRKDVYFTRTHDLRDTAKCSFHENMWTQRCWFHWTNRKMLISRECVSSKMLISLQKQLNVDFTQN